MGLRETLGLRARAVPSSPAVLAQLNPPVMDQPFGTYWGAGSYGGYNNYANAILRQDAASVPAIARCRNLIAGTIASIPLETYSMTTGEELPNLPWVDQLDKRQPMEVTIAWLVDSLFYYGVAYLRVEEVYKDDNRPARFSWMQNDRVTVKYAANNSEVDYYMVNNIRVPDSGVGSLVTFQGFDQGLLLRQATTIRAAIDLEKAAAIAAQTPMGSGYIKNTGADLPDQQVQGILNSWKTARQSKATAYLTSTLEFNPISFSPKDMMYNEAKAYLALDLARACNVPAPMIDAEMIRSNTYQNVLDQRKEFAAYTLMPFINAIQSRLSMDDLLPRGTCVKFAVDETFLRVDPVTRLQVTEKLLELQLIDLNEAKEMEGLASSGSGEDVDTEL
jgi:HK97 family phage portal protein